MTLTSMLRILATRVKFLRNLLPSGCKLESVSVLGGRKNVMAACRANQGETRPCLYIIDADFDLLLGVSKPRLRNLYRLRAYSIENYLLQPKALSEVATTFSPKLSSADAARRLAIDNWFEENRPCLEKLFLAYAVSYAMDGSQETVGYSVHRLLVNGSDRKKLCPTKVRTRVRGIYSELMAKYDRDEITQCVKKVRINQRKLGCDRYVSSKDYVMPQIFMIMKREFGVNVMMEAFKSLLALHVSETSDPYLRRRLHETIVRSGS